jgi:hypothetical protein
MKVVSHVIDDSAPNAKLVFEEVARELIILRCVVVCRGVGICIVVDEMTRSYTSGFDPRDAYRAGMNPPGTSPEAALSD